MLYNERLSWCWAFNCKTSEFFRRKNLKKIKIYYSLIAWVFKALNEYLAEATLDFISEFISVTS